MPLLTAKYAEVFAKGAIVFLPQRKRSFTQRGIFMHDLLLTAKYAKLFAKSAIVFLPQRERSFPQRAERYFYA
ncbi:hypothetical protein SAMN04488511_11060 [Pedobacter suwonensis]|uniref:Uncharacterized protein n=1 Tax=Pedobacter suwonensis TaxID=332999 RepID=A0A1I0TKH9_9SPHI|nr:hypothetical protein SAMN04488511_11060 [Pedobacter suwonensis]